MSKRPAPFDKPGNPAKGVEPTAEMLKYSTQMQNNLPPFNRPENPAERFEPSAKTLENPKSWKKAQKSVLPDVELSTSGLLTKPHCSSFLPNNYSIYNNSSKCNLTSNSVIGAGAEEYNTHSEQPKLLGTHLPSVKKSFPSNVATAKAKGEIGYEMLNLRKVALANSTAKFQAKRLTKTLLKSNIQASTSSATFSQSQEKTSNRKTKTSCEKEYLDTTSPPSPSLEHPTGTDEAHWGRNASTKVCSPIPFPQFVSPRTTSEQISSPRCKFVHKKTLYLCMY